MSDDLRAAAERAVQEFDRPGYTSMPLALMSALDDLRAALAASPAATTPDDVFARCDGESFHDYANRMRVLAANGWR